MEKEIHRATIPNIGSVKQVEEFFGESIKREKNRI
jgi:hypothetical protein